MGVLGYNCLMRFFNTAGPCNPDKHYMIPAASRFGEDVDIWRLISQEAYFVIHAPRQVGKTTTMLQLAQDLTASGQYISVLLSMEVRAAFLNDTETAERAIVQNWANKIQEQLPPGFQPPSPSCNVPKGNVICDYLGQWAFVAPRPLALFLDEFDALQDEVLNSVLPQLRAGYNHRPQGFPSSLALIGLHDVSKRKTRVPFNIVVRSITLRPFSATETHSLLQQHTSETGQLFTEASMERIYYLTQGQPWLVNALARLCVEELVTDLVQPVEAIYVDKAKEILIQRRQTHLDALADKLREPRVRHIIEPILAGGTLGDLPRDDVDYVLDLGLVVQENGSGLLIANPIYQEVIPRELASVPQASLPRMQPVWLNADGSLDPDKLLAAFLAFWRQHGQPLLKAAPYHEIAPHLVLMAFLHRVVNGGGTLEREYAIGTGKMDLCLRYGAVTVAMELKVWRDGQRDPLQQGLEQLDNYLSGLRLEAGWLVIFDQRSGLPPISERTETAVAVTPGNRTVTVIRG
jgi:hypothetical protein